MEDLSKLKRKQIKILHDKGECVMVGIWNLETCYPDSIVFYTKPLLAINHRCKLVVTIN